MKTQTELFLKDSVIPKTGYQQTSREAYKEIVKDPVKLNQKQQTVFNCIKFMSERFGPPTDLEINNWLYWEINQVTGRRNELVAKGLIEQAGTKKQNGRNAITWRVKQ